MTEQELLALLDARGVAYSLYRHAPIFSAKDPTPTSIANPELTAIVTVEQTDAGLSATVAYEGSQTFANETVTPTPTPVVPDPDNPDPTDPDPDEPDPDEPDPDDPDDPDEPEPDDPDPDNPTDPTDPDDPTPDDPTPTDPTDPTTPDNPTNPDDPTPANPDDPAEPTELTDSDGGKTLTRTGDNTPFALLTLVIGLSGAAVITFGTLRRRPSSS